MVYHKVQPLRPLDNQSDPLIRPFIFNIKRPTSMWLGLTI